MTEVACSELWSTVYPAVVAVRSFVLTPERKLGYVPRLNVPQFSRNESGWPNMVSDTFSSKGDDAPIDWNLLIGARKGPVVQFDASDIPELVPVIDLITGNEFLNARICSWTLGIEYTKKRLEFAASTAVRFVTDVVERAEALHAITEEEVKGIYVQLERSYLAEELEAELVYPLALANLQLDGRFEISPGLYLEELDEAFQCARAPRMGTSSEVNPYLVAAATHAIVLDKQTFDNRQGPDHRFLEAHFASINKEAVDFACQALGIVCGFEVGYAQILLRPVGWADDWKHDLPPCRLLHTIRRYPRILDETGWNKKQRRIEQDVLDRLPNIFSALSSTTSRAKLAARRLALTSQRSRSDDQILDACIGIEALVGEEHDELVHRMALRSAMALAMQGANASFAYEALKKVYGHRSKIIHGTEPKKSTMILGKDSTEFSTRSVAIWLLRMLLRSHLESSPRWDPAALDQLLFTSMETQFQRTKGRLED